MLLLLLRRFKYNSKLLERIARQNLVVWRGTVLSEECFDGRDEVCGRIFEFADRKRRSAKEQEGAGKTDSRERDDDKMFEHC